VVVKPEKQVVGNKTGVKKPGDLSSTGKGEKRMVRGKVRKKPKMERKSLDYHKGGSLGRKEAHGVKKKKSIARRESKVQFSKIPPNTLPPHQQRS